MSQTLPLPRLRERLLAPKTLLIATLLAVLVSCTGLFVLWLLNEPAEDELIRFVPEDATAYVHVFLKPSSQERLDIEALLRRTLGTEDASADIKYGFEAILQEVLGPAGLTYRDDVEPWLGKQIAAFAVEGGGYAVIVETKGDDEARPLQAAANQIIPPGVPFITEMIDDHLVVGTEGAISSVRSVVDGEDSLAGDDDLELALRDLPQHRVAFVHLAEPAVDATISVRPDGLQIDLSSVESDATVLASAGLRLFPATLLGVAVEGFPEIPTEPGLTALRLAGAIRSGTDDDDRSLGDGYTARTVLIAAPLIELGESFGLLDSQPWIRAVGPYLSRIVIGESNRPDLMRIFIGVQ